MASKDTPQRTDIDVGLPSRLRRRPQRKRRSPGRPRERVVDRGGRTPQSDLMNRALGVLTCGAFLSIVLGGLGAGEPLLALMLGAVFTACATLGFGGCAAATGG